MDLIFPGNCNERHDETVLYSETFGSHNELKYAGLDSFPPKATGCSHFSIRGYVAKIHKHDWRTCWPFPDFPNHSDIEKHNLLPPMTVADFRWWDCHGCLGKLNPKNNITPDGSTRTGLPYKSKIKGKSLDINPTIASHATEIRSSSHHQVASGNALANGRSIDSYGARAIETHEQYQPLPSSPNGEQELITTGPVKQVAQSCINNGNALEAVPMQGASKSMSFGDVNGHKQSKRREQTSTSKVDICVSRREKVVTRLPVTIPGHNIKIGPCNKGYPKKSDDLLRKTTKKCRVAPMQKETDVEIPSLQIMCQFSKKDFEMLNKSTIKKKTQKKSRPLFLGKMNHIPKANTKKSKIDYMVERTLMGSSKEKEVILGRSSLIGNKTLHQKKEKKTRMLNEIMESESLGVSSSISASFTGNLMQLDASNSKSDVLREEVVDGERKLEDSFQKEKGKIPKNKKRHLPELEDDGSSIKHGLNRVPEKVKPVKLATKSGLIYHRGHSESIEMVPSGKLLDYGTKVSRSNQYHDPLSTKGEKSRISWAEAEQQRIATFKKHEDEMNFVIGEGNGKRDPKINPTKSTTDVIGKRILQTQLTQNDKPHKKGSMENKQSKIPQHKDGEYPSIHVMKDSLEISKDEEIDIPRSSVLTPEKVAAKKSNNISDAADVDGIPVEILKLLQENWLKRHLVSAKCSGKNGEEMPKLTKDMEVGTMQELANNNRKEATVGVLENQFMQNCLSKSFDAGPEMLPALVNNQTGQHSQAYKSGSEFGFAGKVTESSCYPLHVDACCVNDIYSRGKMIHHDKACLVTDYNVPLHLREQQKCGPEHLFIDSSGNSCPEYSRSVTWNADYYKGEAMSIHDPRGSYSFNLCSTPLSSIPIGMSDSPNCFSDLNYLRKSSQNSVPRQKKGDMTVDVGLTQATDVVGMDLQTMNVSDPKSKKGLDVDNIPCREMSRYSKMMPCFDLKKNDTFSAMHLLRLMDPAVCSSAPSSLLARDQMLVHKQSNILCTDQHAEPYGAESSTRVNQRLIHELEWENFARSHHSQKPSNSLLVPGNGFAGSLFPKGNFLCSDGDRQLFPKSNCRYGETQLFPIRDHGKEKLDISCHASQTSCSFLSCNESMKENVLYMLNYAGQTKSEKRNEHLYPGKKEKVQVPISANKSCQIQPCTLNRNPADFTIPDDDNEYMRSYDDLGFRETFVHSSKLLQVYPNHHRKKKAMKLTALKELIRN